MNPSPTVLFFVIGLAIVAFALALISMSRSSATPPVKHLFTKPIHRRWEEDDPARYDLND